MNYDNDIDFIKKMIALKEEILKYINDQYISPEDRDKCRYSRKFITDEPADRYNPSKTDLLLIRIGIITDSRDLIKEFEKNRDATFVEKLLYFFSLDERKDSQIYKSVDIDRKLFSKITSDAYYKPSKDTAIAFCFALKLELKESSDLLRRAGYTLSHSDKRDLVIEYFLRNRIFDIMLVNEMLNKLNFKVIGREY